MKKKYLAIILISFLSVTFAVFLCCCGIDTSNVAGSASQLYNSDENAEEYSDETQFEEDAEDTDEVMVWVPRTGQCYHNNPNCSNMKNPVQMPLSKAKRDKKACTKCYD